MSCTGLSVLSGKCSSPRFYWCLGESITRCLFSPYHGRCCRCHSLLLTVFRRAVYMKISRGLQGYALICSCKYALIGAFVLPVTFNWLIRVCKLRVFFECLDHKSLTSCGKQCSWSPAEVTVHTFWKVGQDVMLAAASPIRFCYPSIAVSVGRKEIVKNMLGVSIVFDCSWTPFCSPSTILLVRIHLVFSNVFSLGHLCSPYSGERGKGNFLKVNYLIWDRHLTEVLLFILWS